MRFKQSFFILAVLVFVMETCQGCEQDQTRQGCRIQNGVCLCGIGCYSEYRYTTKEECRKALRGSRRDVCQRNPCRNGGACSQTSFEPGYRCRCEGTGYYGSRCQHACPSPNTALQDNETFPYECVVI
ncbi:adhesive plaque matrix protein 2 isoform X3 [Cryptotermes secundus]|uniref:adhesive plaque matrix protein 2 isoform X3 n=1 Tax=Cryptotermes secundus TaxID=105785 RepID=UPI000CD7B87A|nr:adhesive plaque matrix protein 2 isoform X3 [Cryptotermes secundus]